MLSPLFFPFLDLQLDFMFLSPCISSLWTYTVRVPGFPWEFTLMALTMFLLGSCILSQ